MNTNPIARMLDAVFGDFVRAHYAKKYGTCRVCARPLGGESPDHVCVECHAGEMLARGFADGIAGSEAADA